MVNAVGNIFYFEAHWLFAWRYWQVSEVLLRVRSKSMCSNWVHYLLNGVVSLLIFANYGWSIMDSFINQDKLEEYYLVWFPFTFILLDAFVLSVAVIRVYRVLR